VEAAEEEHLQAWEETPVGQESPAYGRAYIAMHLMQLLRHLKAEGMLPALVFNFERRGCEMFAGVVLEVLEEQEAAARLQYEKQLDKIRRSAAEKQAAAAAADEGGGVRVGRGAGGGGERSSSGTRGKAGQSDEPEAAAIAASTVCLEGIVFSLDEEMPDPSFTFLTQDKARSEVSTAVAMNA
jgi:hypothetical protein